MEDKPRSTRKVDRTWAKHPLNLTTLQYHRHHCSHHLLYYSIERKTGNTRRYPNADLTQPHSNANSNDKPPNPQTQTPSHSNTNHTPYSSLTPLSAIGDILGRVGDPSYRQGLCLKTAKSGSLSCLIISSSLSPSGSQLSPS